MEVQRTKRVVWNKLLQCLSILKGNVISVEALGTRWLIVNQEELVVQDATIITIMCMKAMVEEQIKMLIMSIYIRIPLFLL